MTQENVKKEKKSRRFELIIPVKDFNKWKEYSDKLGVPVAKLVKNTVNRAVRQADLREDKKENEKQSEISKINKKIDELEMNMRTMISELVNSKEMEEVNDDVKLEGQIISLLTDFSSLTRNQIQRYTKADMKQLIKVLPKIAEIQDDRSWRLKI
ncbi:hypothetical protein [Candidatus Lokiarchaeum ossiferum]|uniref:hypothetical protein n=1 Tax=Candidatus Lokiarchaeum ossiferum TaxID=2951803 RepID=UPI00352FB467